MDRVVMDGSLQRLGEAIAAALPGAIGEISTAHSELTLTVEPGRVIEAVTYLRDDPRCLFVSFTDLTAVDYPVREKRFDV
ncbi:MAG: NADH-quinone oxidoreductase subunit C, partial [Methylocella sp.]